MYRGTVRGNSGAGYHAFGCDGAGCPRQFTRPLSQGIVGTADEMRLGGWLVGGRGPAERVLCPACRRAADRINGASSVVRPAGENGTVPELPEPGWVYAGYRRGRPVG